MSKEENAYYQHLARSVREKYNRGSPEKWPGKPVSAPAVSLYPNFLAELAAMPWPNIKFVAEFANVSPEIVTAVVEDGEELSAVELLGAARAFRRNLGYLASHTLAVVDPATNKGKRRLWELETLLDRVGEFDWRKACEIWRDGLREGYRITYAQWRWACLEIEDTLEYRQHTEKKRRATRTARRVTA